VSAPESPPIQPRKRDRTHLLYISVIVAVAAGILVGLVWPEVGKDLKPLGTGFVNLIKMMISPIIFCTIVLGVGSVAKAAKVGRVGTLAIGYFLLMSTVALVIGLVVGNILHPGEGLQLTNEVRADGQDQVATSESTADFLLGIIPNTLVSAFTEGSVLQTLLVALLTGFALQAMRSKGEPILYVSNPKGMNREIRRLAQQGLVAQKPLNDERSGAKRLLVLTKRGKSLVLKSGRLAEGQAIYHGLVKPREAKHDAALYRLYQRETARIAEAGGRPVRVVLDYELKRNLHRDLAQLGESGRTREVRERFAEKHGLVVVGGKVQIPDLRLEYETAELGRRHVDLELATRNYRPRALAQKAKAGFSLYAPREDASKLRRVLHEAELTARILSL